MKKLRVFELARDYGMKGPELAKLLRDLGFEQIKTHMTVLDAADEMQVLARLEASGLHRKPEGAPEEAAAPKLLKKKQLPHDDLETAVETEPEEEPALREPKKQLPKVPLRRKKADTAAEAVEAPAEAEPTPVSASGPAEIEVEAVAPTPPPVVERPAVATPAEAAPPAAAESQPAPTPAAPKPAPEPVAEVQTSPVPPPAAPAPAEVRAAEPPAPAVPAAPVQPARDQDVKRLLVPQKRATVVGRIELPQETIRDATRRSAPAAERDLRRAALQKTQQRTAMRSSSPQGRRGPGGPLRPGQRGDTSRPGMRRTKTSIAPSVDPNKVVEITAPVSIKNLSEALGIKVTELIKVLTFNLNVPGKNINSYLSQDEVELVAIELERKVKIVEHRAAEEEMLEQLVETAAGEDEFLRAPVVTFMGHVDHGKTSLLDALRHSDVTRGEAGGITQHIGAYKVTTEKDQQFVILDTPGHAAFTAMRARGADLTDIVVLVVAADDGVMPQTEEAINHAKAANVPIVVAINKCDLPGANPMQVKQQLMVKGLQSEEWGGNTGMVEVSAVTKKGLGDLVDRLMLEAEILELKARPDAFGRGIVVESKQSPEQGVVVTVLVTDGTLKLKDQIVCGESFSRVRAMVDDHGRQLTEAGPSTPVTIFGLDRLPNPGDKLFVVEDAKKAREVVEDRQRRIRELSLAERSAVTLETLSAKLAAQKIEEIKVILKADAMGSLEPLRKCLEELSTPEVRVNLVHSALGGINETDVSLADASGAVIVGFNTVADASAREAAERVGVQIRYYDVIYELLDQMKVAMEGLLKPEEVETVLGHAEVRAVFKSSKFGLIAGCYVTDGIAKRSAKVRLSRDSRVVYSGKVASLRRVSDDVRDVRAGFECGLTLQDFQDVKVGDIIEFAQVDLVKRTLA